MELMVVIMKYDLLKFPKIYKTHFMFVCLFAKMVLNRAEKHAD